MLTADLSNHGNGPVAPLHVAPFQCFVLARSVVEQRVQLSRLLRVLFDKPYLVATQEIRIEQRRVMRRKDQLRALRVFVSAQQSNEKSRDVRMQTPVDLVGEQRRTDGQST